GHTVIRAFIHKPGGVTIDDCKNLSRAYSDYLDTDDPIAGEFKLEVSSLGLDRPLKEPADYKRRMGEAVKLELKKSSYPKRRARGKLIEIDEKGVTLLIESQEEHFDYDNIIKGKIVF
ncbi:MAG: ribosome maturation factor RimP, partial [candidate division Zixibacteria bacterium]|nr:ribosome maturation factor RimP [candidate division Zixibacteria bacterium]